MEDDDLFADAAKLDEIMHEPQKVSAETSPDVPKSNKVDEQLNLLMETDQEHMTGRLGRPPLSKGGWWQISQIQILMDSKVNLELDPEDKSIVDVRGMWVYCKICAKKIPMNHAFSAHQFKLHINDRAGKHAAAGSARVRTLKSFWSSPSASSQRLEDSPAAPSAPTAEAGSPPPKLPVPLSWALAASTVERDGKAKCMGLSLSRALRWIRPQSERDGSFAETLPDHGVTGLLMEHSALVFKTLAQAAPSAVLDSDPRCTWVLKAADGCSGVYETAESDFEGEWISCTACRQLWAEVKPVFQDNHQGGRGVLVKAVHASIILSLPQRTSPPQVWLQVLRKVKQDNGVKLKQEKPWVVFQDKCMAALSYLSWLSNGCPSYLQEKAKGSALSVDEVLVREFKNIVYNPSKKAYLDSGIMGITKLLCARAHGRQVPPSPEVYEILMALHIESPRSERLLREASSILLPLEGCGQEEGKEHKVVRILPHTDTVRAHVKKAKSAHNSPGLDLLDRSKTKGHLHAKAAFCISLDEVMLARAASIVKDKQGQNVLLGVDKKGTEAFDAEKAFAGLDYKTLFNKALLAIVVPQDATDPVHPVHVRLGGGTAVQERELATFLTTMCEEYAIERNLTYLGPWQDAIGKGSPFTWYMLIEAYSGRRPASGGIDGFHELRNMRNHGCRGPSMIIGGLTSPCSLQEIGE